MKSSTRDSRSLRKRSGSPKVERRRLICRVRGRVQGVGFRYRAAEHARDLGLTGYAQNLPDGGVELVAEGSLKALAELKTFCYRGPDGAKVEAVSSTEESATDEFQNFEVR